MKPELLAALTCPVTRTPLRFDAAADELVSVAAALAFPVRGGTPVLLVEAARALNGEPAQQQR